MQKKRSYERLEEAIPGILSIWREILEDDLNVKIISYLFKERDRTKFFFAPAQDLEDEIRIKEELIKKFAKYTSLDYLSKKLKIDKEELKQRLDRFVFEHLVDGFHLDNSLILYTIDEKELNYFLSKPGYEFIKDNFNYLLREEKDRYISLSSLFSS